MARAHSVASCTTKMDNWARLRILGASAIGGYVLYKIYVLKRRKDAFYVLDDADAPYKERKPSLTRDSPMNGGVTLSLVQNAAPLQDSPRSGTSDEGRGWGVGQLARTGGQT